MIWLILEARLLHVYFLFSTIVLCNFASEIAISLGYRKKVNKNFVILTITSRLLDSARKAKSKILF